MLPVGPLDMVAVKVTDAP
jgi:hypothetical protein